MRFGTQSWLAVWMLVSVTACGDSDGDEKLASPADDAGTDAAPDDMKPMAPKPVPKADLDEMVGLGIREFLGKAKPTKSETIQGVNGVSDGSIVYDFNPDDGPKCLRGSAFQMSVLDQGSKNLMIFMQGGGACVSVICQATTEPTPRGVPNAGVLDPRDPDNPVASWNIVYVPYCDGSVFGGNNDFGSPSDATGMRFHHGQRNFAAALDRALEHFPHPEKVLLVGSSAGGWGTVFHRALVRTAYPEAELTVMNDSGIGFAVNSDLVANEWGSGPRYRPPSCEECQMHQHLLPFVKYDLEHDPGIVVGDFSSYEDSVIQLFTFTDGPTFHQLLLDETGIPAQAAPERYKRFFINGSQHTSLQRGFHTTQINGVTISQWLAMMIARDPAWTEMLE